MACLTAATLAGAATFPVAVAWGLGHEVAAHPPADLGICLLVGAAWGQILGLGMSLTALSFGERRGKTVHALIGAGWAAGLTAVLTGPPLWMWVSSIAAC